MHFPQGTTFISDEVMNGAIEINNPKHIRIKRIECKIEATVQVGDDSYTVDIFKVNLPNLIDINEAIRTETFQIPTPENLPPSYDYTVDSGSKQTAVVVKYALSFLFHVIEILSDFEIVKPTLVATNLRKHEEDKDRPVPTLLVTNQQNSDEIQLVIPSTLEEENKTSLTSDP
jgi:hypothetical protein